MSLGIYIHIPFCRTKCLYCHFLSQPLEAGTAVRYIEALTREIVASPGPAGEVDSVYFGGGTPSLLDPGTLARVLEACRRRFVLSADCEISIEANPGTLSPVKATRLRGAGFNRVSVGAQSFSNRELSGVGRVHDSAMISRSVAILRQSGFENIGLDLLLGLPHQTRRSWLRTVDRACALPVTHLSVYMLDLDTDCPLRRLAAAGRIALPPEDLVADLYLETLDKLTEKGFEQYEISNFARDGRRCRHNLKYWLRHPVRGFGLGSHSFDGSVRSSNCADLGGYCAAVLSGRDPVEFSETLSPEQARGERLFLGLRLNEGVGCDQIGWLNLEDFAGRGLIRRQGSRICLTPSGMLLSNEIFQSFLLEPS